MKQRTFIAALLFTSLLPGACNSKRSDKDIRDEITRRLSTGANSTHNNYPNLNVDVKEAVVTLSGKCQGDNCADSIVARVNTVKDIKRVVNNISMEPVPTDLTLRTAVQTIVSKYDGVQAEVTEGNIVLRGIINRDQLQPLMNELTTLRAKKIDNQLAIR